MSTAINRSELEALQRMRWVAGNRHDYAKEWKQRTGGKVVGYLCTYVPEELLYAAGILPVRILGGKEPQDITEQHIYNMFCSYCRDCLAQGLLGRYSYLDGIVAAHGCIEIQQTFDSWQRHIPTPYKYWIFMPRHIQGLEARAYLPKELAFFRDSLQELTGQVVGEEALLQAIEVYNTNRRLMRQVYELMKDDAPLVSGTEAMEMVLASQLMDKKEHNELLRQLLTGLRGRERRGGNVRLMLVGAELDDPALPDLIESMGTNIVVDDNCVGTRYFWNEAPLGNDAIASIAQRYADKPPCPMFDIGKRLRLPHILKLARDFRVRSAILLQMKFCNPHQYDMPSIIQMFSENNIPTLELEYDLGIPMGQFRTRIEAHLEMLEVS